jgi:hypothetical protein
MLPQSKLLDDESRAKLPSLYSNEKVGLKALAQVKFFTPDNNWTWYASEGSYVDENGYFDTDKEKVDYLFFGLVIGFEIEVGYFGLSELSQVRGALGLPIERDVHFKPKPLDELQAQHRAERGE